MADPTGSVILSKGKIETVGGGFETKPPVVNVGHPPIGGAITDFQKSSTSPSGTNRGLPEDTLRASLTEASRRNPLDVIQRNLSEAIRMPLPSAKAA